MCWHTANKSRNEVLSCVLSTSGIPLIHTDYRVGSATGQSRNCKNIPVLMLIRPEREVVLRPDVLLEKPQSNVGIAIVCETLSSEHKYLVIACANVYRRVTVRDGVLVWHGVGCLPLPTGRVIGILGTALCKDPRRIFRGNKHPSDRITGRTICTRRPVERVPVVTPWYCEAIAVEFENASWNDRHYNSCET